MSILEWYVYSSSERGATKGNKNKITGNKPFKPFREYFSRNGAPIKDSMYFLLCAMFTNKNKTIEQAHKKIARYQQK